MPISRHPRAHPSPRQPLTHFLSLYSCFLWACLEWTHTQCVTLFLTFSTGRSVLEVLPCCCMSFGCWIIFHHTCHILCICSSADEHLGCFHFLAVVLPSLDRKSCILEKSYGLGIDIISGVWLAQAGAFWLIHSSKPLSIYSFFVPSTGLSPGSPAVSKMHMAHAFMGLSCRQAVSEQIKAGEY